MREKLIIATFLLSLMVAAALLTYFAVP